MTGNGWPSPIADYCWDDMYYTCPQPLRLCLVRAMLKLRFTTWTLCVFLDFVITFMYISMELLGVLSGQISFAGRVMIGVHCYRSCFFSIICLAFHGRAACTA